MTGQTDDPHEISWKAVLWVWLCWLGVAVMLYILSVGPVMKITLKRNSSNPHPAAQLFGSFYKPLEWAYTQTLLHRPLGLYYHLWILSIIDSNGNMKT